MANTPLALEAQHPRPGGKVFIVDDDPLIRSTLEHSLSIAGLASIKFTSAEQFLAFAADAPVGCVLTDFRMPGMSGVELQEELARRSCPMPVVLMTGYADVPIAVRAIKAGALNIIQKPFKTEELLHQVREALVVAEERFSRHNEKTKAKLQFESLTPREKDVLGGLLFGYSNKEIAYKHELSPRTVESHRAKVMEKLQVDSIVALLKKAALLSK